MNNVMKRGAYVLLTACLNCPRKVKQFLYGMKKIS